MQPDKKTTSRRTLIAASLAVGAIAALTAAGRSAAGARRRGNGRAGDGRSNFAFGRTAGKALSADDTSLPRRARDLIRIGNDGIARENVPAMTAFFHPHFRFHGPGGELDRDQLWAYFAACRAAFDDFTVTRQAIVSDGGDYVASRTRFAGTFARPFTMSPAGTLQPNGKRFGYQLINIFRYADDGRLAEEWAQYDVQAFLAQLQAQ